VSIPFQLEDSSHDPVGTTREEIPDGAGTTIIWVCEEVILREEPRLPKRWAPHRRWRCAYASGPNVSGMVDQVLSLDDAAGFPVIGAVPGTPAEPLWNAHLARKTDPGDVISLETRAKVQELLDESKHFNAIRVLREDTGWELSVAKEYVDQMRREQTIDAGLAALAEKVGR
jgi:hypothetical protein